ncbi:MAG: TIGR02757 family protein [Deltaproteobacteria bacterium]|nr:TIGR02757 family protein [Deltaproteobacteria bacterium]
MPSLFLEDILENLYQKYNRREYIHPDPLEFLYDYEDLRDREIAGLVASSLAYGRVSQIIRSVAFVLERMTPSPFRFIEDASMESLLDIFSGFKHRFTTGDELAEMLFGVKTAIKKHGSLHACFKAGLLNDNESSISAITRFVEELGVGFHHRNNSLLPSPVKGSACKRLNLFFRWMIRQDDVDPGGWEDISPLHLVVPLDTHLHRLCLSLGFTNRRQADMKTAMEITDAFRTMVPHDPVRYDFALTRLGIRKDTDMTSFLNECGKTKMYYKPRSAHEA